jgi:GNAT superfamily N-acetyltransferase
MDVQRQSAESSKAEISVRPLQENDLSDADLIVRLAFGTFLGVPDPKTFMGDADYVRTRWRTDPSSAFGAFGAESGGELVGSNFATNWGSVGFFGPLTIRPDFWDRGVGGRLMEPIIGCFDKWGTTQAGLYTFAHSQKHIGLYQKFGFWPRFLTAIMSKAVAPAGQTEDGRRWTRFSEVPEAEREGTIRACSQLTDAIYEGLDVGQETRAVAGQVLGETVLLWDDGKLAGFAVCHMGPGSEAGSGTCYIKFGAARPGPTAGQDFDRLLDACEEIAAGKALSRLVAGVNLARHEAYRRMLERGFHTDIQGVTMHRPNEPGYNRPGVYLIDDWR